MKVLISIKDEQEARKITEVKGVDIVDIKNPDEGTLGANIPSIIKSSTKILPSNIEKAASIGDIDFRPGSASLASYGTALLGLDYITASYSGLKSSYEFKIMTEMLLRSLEDFDTGLIVAAYADHERSQSPDPKVILSEVVGADYFMVDTALKDGKSVLDFATIDELITLKEKALENGIKLIIAGSIRYPQLDKIKEIDPCVVGFRGIICDGGIIKKELLEKLLRELR